MKGLRLVKLQSITSISGEQGERSMAADCRSLAEFELTGIPPAPRGVPKIQVTFFIDANGILSVEATDLGTGMTTEVSITPHSGLSETEIDHLVADAAEQAELDAERQEDPSLTKAREDAMAMLAQLKADEEAGLVEPTEWTVVEPDEPRPDWVPPATPPEVREKLAAREAGPGWVPPSTPPEAATAAAE